MNTILQTRVEMSVLVALVAIALAPFSIHADAFYFDYGNYGYGDSYLSAFYGNDDFEAYFSNDRYYDEYYYDSYYYASPVYFSFSSDSKPKTVAKTVYQPVVIPPPPTDSYGNPYGMQYGAQNTTNNYYYSYETSDSTHSVSSLTDSQSAIKNSYDGAVTVSSGTSLKTTTLTPVSQTTVSYHPVNYTYSYPYGYNYNNQYSNQYPYNYNYGGYNDYSYNYPYTYTYGYNTSNYTQPSCSLSITYGTYSGGAGYNQATLSWSSQNATSASISPDVGPVPSSGSRVVYAPQYNQSYTMTVYGPGGSANCYASGGGYYTYPGATYPNYAYPSAYPNYDYNYYTMPYPTTSVISNTGTTASPYVSLSQIPYTGFDFGTLGNSLYWLAIIAFAAFGAYLIVYYRGGAFMLARQMIGVPGRTRSQRAPVPRVLPALPVLSADDEEEKPETEVEPERAFNVKDTMSLAHSEGEEMPRIIINRS